MSVVFFLQLGQTPVEEAEGAIRAFLRVFEVCVLFQHCFIFNAFILDTVKLVLWQTVNTQMKCRIRRHFIRVCTVC